MAKTLLSRLEAKFGRYAIPNLTLILIAGQVLVYVADQFARTNGGSVLPAIQLTVSSLLEGKVWLLVTFLFDPPPMNVVFAFFFWYFFYFMGTTLEANWGDFRYNVFLFIGYLASIAFAVLTAFVFGAKSAVATNIFLQGTVFLAFARLYPEFIIYLFFVLPVKIKWMAWLTWAGYIWMFLFGGWMARAMVLAATLNYFLFFGRDIWLNMKHADRRMRFQAKALQKPSRLVHTCGVCGITSDESPKTQFRYCSQCGGDVCYCPEHLHNHKHVVPASAT